MGASGEQSSVCPKEVRSLSLGGSDSPGLSDRHFGQLCYGYSGKSGMTHCGGAIRFFLSASSAMSSIWSNEVF